MNMFLISSMTSMGGINCSGALHLMNIPKSDWLQTFRGAAAKLIEIAK